jgi:hypothetical protein
MYVTKHWDQCAEATCDELLLAACEGREDIGQSVSGVFDAPHLDQLAWLSKMIQVELQALAVGPRSILRQPDAVEPASSRSLVLVSHRNLDAFVGCPTPTIAGRIILHERGEHTALAGSVGTYHYRQRLEFQGDIAQAPVVLDVQRADHARHLTALRFPVEVRQQRRQCSTVPKSRARADPTSHQAGPGRTSLRTARHDRQRDATEHEAAGGEQA